MMQPKETLHQNYINDCQPYVRDGSGNTQVLTTCDPNGSINYWNVAEHLWNKQKQDAYWLATKWQKKINLKSRKIY